MKFKAFCLVIFMCLLFIYSARATTITSSVTDYLCDYKWHCDDWKPTNCSSGKEQFRECTNLGNCAEDFSPPTEKRECPIVKGESVIDAKLKLINTVFYENEKLISILVVYNKGEKLMPVNITYSVVDELNNTVFVYLFHDIVEKEKAATKKFDELELKNGLYFLVAEITYDGGNKTVKQIFEVQKNSVFYFYYLVWAFLIICLIFYVGSILKRKKKMSKIKRQS